MRFISFPFHGLEQLVEYNRNNTAVKRFLPIYASRCTRYPHYESPPAKTQSFPQHCQCTGKRCFQQFIGGSKPWVATSSGDVFSAARTHRHEKKTGISSAPIGDIDPRIQRKRFRQPRGDRARSDLNPLSAPRENYARRTPTKHLGNAISKWQKSGSGKPD